MQLCGEMLRAYASRIASAAAEHVDAESFEEPLHRVVQNVIACLALEQGADVSPLRKAGADDAVIGRLLRAAEAEIIEVLRTRSEGQEFAACVLSLRVCIRKSLPAVSLNSEGVRLYQKFLGDLDHGTDGGDRRLTSLFNGIIKNVRDMIFIHDVSGNLLYVNDYGLGMIKYTRQDLLDGISIYDVVVSKYIDLVEERMAAPGGGNLSPFTIEVYAKDGERIPIEIDSRILLSPDGEADAVVGVARDLRLERRFQQDIRRTHNYVESLLSLAPIGVLITNDEGVICEANPLAAAMCGAPSTNALIGLSVYDLGESDDSSARAALHYVVETGKDYRERISIRSRFGKMMTCDAIAAPLVLENGALDGLIVLFIDLSEQITLQRELMKTEKLSSLGEIVARAAHELNNPLTGILGYAQFLHNAIDNPAHKERLGRMLEEAHRCRRIVENLLSFAKRGERRMLPHDVNGLVREAYSLCEYALSVDRVQVKLELAPSLPVIPCSAQDLERAFLNLIKNAHQALLTVNEDSRRLTISSEQEGRFIRVIFADTGPGVRPELVEKVFEPFFTTRDVGEGIGLGLSVAYAIAADHGGFVQLENRNGGGAAFTVVLPVRS